MNRPTLTMRAKTMAAAALLVLATATGAAGQPRCTADEVTDRPSWDCFYLWTGCGDISVIVLVDENTIGVRHADVENAVESRLRAAGVYADNRNNRRATLTVFTHFTASGAFFVEMWFTRRGVLHDEYGFWGNSPTWHGNAYGIHGGRASEVMEAMRQRLDEFMNNYLRVNAPACAARQ